MLLLMISILHSSACLPHPEATPCLYFHSNHIPRTAFQDFSRHDAPMHRCSRAPELTSSATDRATIISQSQTPLLANHHLINYYCAGYSTVQLGTARRSTVLQHAALPLSPVDGTNALPPPRIVSSYRPTPGHLQLHMLRGTHIPALLGPFLPTSPEFTARSLAPRAREAEARWFNVWDGTLYRGTK